MKRKAFKAVNFLLAVVLAVGCIAFAGCYDDPKSHTVEEQIEQISERVEIRYINVGTEYTGYKVYPVYDHQDELSCFLIELEPIGFFFVRRGSTPPFGRYYQARPYPKNSWFRYRFCINGVEPEPYEGRQWVVDEVYEEYHEGLRREVDENGKFVEHKSSPYKVAGVVNQKLYLLDLYYSEVPAIKQDGKYINLVSMEEFVYQGDKQYYQQLGSKYLYDHIPMFGVSFLAEVSL